jgi:hypothetical protein
MSACSPNPAFYATTDATETAEGSSSSAPTGGSPEACADPSLLLDFVEGVVDPRLQFSRDTAASFVDASAELRTSAAQTPRYDHACNPACEALGLLVEAASTNEIPTDLGLWTPRFSGLTANADVAPDGTMSAYALADDGAGDEHMLALERPVWFDGEVWTYSVFAKPGSLTELRLVSAPQTSYSIAHFDLDDGLVGSGSLPELKFEVNSGQSLTVKLLSTHPFGGCPVAAIMIEVPESCKHFALALREAVEVVRRAVRPSRHGADVLRLEGVIGEAMARVESAAVGDLLCGLDAEGDVVEFAGKTWHSLGVCPATYFTQSGPTTIERRLFRQSGVHNGPTLDVVAARAGLVGDWTPRAAKAMAHLLQQGTGREAEKTAQEIGRMPYSRSSFERVGHEVGRLYLDRRAEIDGELAERMPMPEGIKSVSVAIDRVAVPMEEIEIGGDKERDRPTRVWHMAHAAALTLHDRRGRALHTVRYACMPDGKIDEMDAALQADLIHVLSLRPRLQVVTLGDGAGEVRRRLDGIVDGVADSAWDVVDYWHAVEKLGAAVRSFSHGPAADELLRRWKGWLLNVSDAVQRIHGELESHAGQTPVDDALTYLDNHGHQMDYAAARAKGLPIGSGNVEASCKSVVRMRMVRGGAKWRHEPGDRVLHLRALAQSDRWDDGIIATLKPLRKRIQCAA